MLRVSSSDRCRRAGAVRAASCTLLACSLLLSPGAKAEDPSQDKAMQGARQKFRQAIALQTGGNWAGALALFRDVASVKSTPQVRFNIAICEENLGQLVQALGDYQLAAAEAREEGSLEVAGEVEGRLATLQARIPKVVIKHGANASRAKISIDGVEVGSSMIGTKLPVDPGSHLIEAEAKGFLKFEKTFDVAEQQEPVVEVVMVAAPVQATGTASGAPAADHAPAAEQRGPNYVPYIVGGVGAASLIASGVFFGLRQKAIGDLNSGCGSNHQACPPSLQSTASSGQTYSTLAVLTLVTGVLGVGGGVTLLLMDHGPSKGAGTALRLVPEAPLANAGVSLVGRF
jgi:hypothetical protein